MMKNYIFDLQRFADSDINSEPKSSADTLKLVGKIINQLGFKNLAVEFNYEPDDKKNNVNIHPLLNFVGSFLYKEAEDLDYTQTQRQTYMSSYATLITRSISIIDNAGAIVLEFENAKPNKPDTSSITGKIASIVDDIGLMGSAISNLNNFKIDSKKSKTSWLLPILTSSVALVFNGLTAIDGLNSAEQLKIQQSCLKFLKTAGSEIIKKIFSDAVSSEFNKIKDGNFDDINVVMGNAKFFTSAAQTITKTIGIFFTLAKSAITGINKYKSTLNKYTDDGIPENMAKHDAVVDAIAIVIHDLASYYMKGLDDLIYVGTRNLVSWITGKEPSIQGNYIEVMADLFKNLNYKNTGTEKADHLISYEDRQYIYAYDGNDTIRNFASSATIWAGNGNDTIFSHSDWEGTSFQSNSILAGPGDDIIISQAVNETIYGGKGKDRLGIYGNNTKAYGEEDDDVIMLSGTSGNLVNGGLGNDIIILEGAQNSIIEYRTGDGKDVIFGYDESDRINITGDYVTSASGNDVTLNIGTGAIILNEVLGKTININGKKIPTVDDVEKRDVLIVEIVTVPSIWDDNVKTIRGTNGNDNIRNSTSNVMIKTLSGNDSVYSTGSNVSISGGAGNNSINGGNGTKYVTASDGDDNVTIGNGYVNVGGGKNNVSLTNSDSNSSTVITGNADDTINIRRAYSDGLGFYNLIQADEGNNYVDNGNRKSSTISSGSGNDTIITGGGSSINAGNGNNLITVTTSQSYNTILTGNGNDYVSIVGYSGENYIYAGAGSNTIVGGNGNNSTVITTGNLDDQVTIGSGYVNVGSGKNNVSLTNSDSNSSTVITGNADDTINIRRAYSDGLGFYNLIQANEGNNYVDNGNRKSSTISSGSGNDTIITGGGSSINAGNGNNWITVTTSNNYNTIITGKGNDTIYLNANSNKNLISLDGGKDIIYGYNATDTINIINSKYSTLSSGNDIIVKFGTNSVTFTEAKGKKLNINTVSGGSSISTNKGGGDSTETSTTTTLTITNNDTSPVTVSSSIKTIDASSRTKAIKIKGNSLNNSIVGGNKTDSLIGLAGNDTLIGGKGNDTLTGGNGKDVFIYANGDGNDIITDYVTDTDSIKLTNGSITSSSLNGSDVILKIGNGSIKVKGAKNKKITVIDSDGKSTSKVYGTTTIPATTTLTLTNNDNSPVTATSKIKTIDANKRTKAIKIVGNMLANSIKGGSGADTIQGGKGADTLTGGKGKDVFVYASGDGKDVITDYTVGQDKIKITGAKISKTSVSSSDIILTVGSGSIKVKNAKGKKLSIYNNSSSLTNTVIGSGSSNSTTLNVINSTKSPVTAGSTIKTINASTRTTAVKITGNSLANSIKGGSAADTLIGGKGNDTLTGGKGNDVFVYTNGDGNDVVTDYTAKQDKIKLNSGTISSSSIKGSDVVLKIGSGSITIKNGKNKSITVVDSKNKSTSKVYGTSSKNYIEKLWFETDDNFTNDEITAITQQNIISDDKVNNANGQLINYDTDNILLNNQQVTSSLVYNRKK